MFVDTSAVFAVLDRDDRAHERARSIWERLLRGEDPLITSNYVVVETAALVQKRLGTDALRTLFADVLPMPTSSGWTPLTIERPSHPCWPPTVVS